MNKKTIQWNDFAGKTPLPHFLLKDSDIAVSMNDDNSNISGEGQCIFPSDDETISSRQGRVNHIHIVKTLEDVYAVINATWNISNVFKQENKWETMLAKKVETILHKPMSSDVIFNFNFNFNFSRRKLFATTLEMKISDDQGEIYAEISVKAYVSKDAIGTYN